ncbi:predicted protein [Streptomyces iranensis]|uniref:Uncharacterized protein n=1 Tax=Streptomyces iranensis TaxID=576784 RepID=A0A060ZDV0_9ACTN|nr:predicted protein [Streptomyces iranensis]
MIRPAAKKAADHQYAVE